MQPSLDIHGILGSGLLLGSSPTPKIKIFLKNPSCNMTTSSCILVFITATTESLFVNFCYCTVFNEKQSGNAYTRNLKRD